MIENKISFRFMAVVAMVLFASNAFAGVVVSGTRVVYDANKQEVMVKLTNKGSKAVLVQSWIDDGDPKAVPSEIQVPFILTPPINRINAEKGQTLRISYTGEALPKDKESVFWLNVLEVPAKNKELEGENYLQMAFRTRIKLFFRPENLKGNANLAIEEVQWKKKDNSISAYNPTPFHISLQGFNLVNGKQVHNIEGVMIAPFSTHDFSDIDAKYMAKGTEYFANYIDDYGAIRPYTIIIK